MKREKTIIYCFAIVFLVGGILGLIKGFFPDMEWLSFRSLLGGGSTFEGMEMPLYVSVFGIVMALLEIVAAILIFMQRRKQLLFVIAIIILNMLGCIVAIFIGDLFAIISLLLRIVPLYFVIKIYHAEKSSEHSV